MALDARRPPADGPAARVLGDLVDALASSAGAHGIRFIDARGREDRVTWAELAQRARRRAARFQAQGLRRGEPALIAMTTSRETVTSFLALVQSGAVPYCVAAPLVGQDRDLHRRRLENLIERHGIRRMVAARELEGVGGIPVDGALLAEPHEQERSPPATPLAGSEAEPSDVVFVQFSSGSTSSPKGVPITHEALLHDLDLITRNDRRRPEDVFVSWLPLYHDMGLVGGLLSNLVLGNELSLMDPLCFLARPVRWLAEISTRRGTLTAIPNFGLSICSERVRDEDLEAHAVDLCSFRYVYVGAEPVRPADVRRFEERFARWGLASGTVRPVYGLAEATLIVTAPRWDEPLVTIERGGDEIPSVGLPLGDLELDVRDDDGRPVEPGSEGEICVRGKAIMKGYLRPPVGEDEPLRDGWLLTGDLGLVDGDGRLFITGRKKDLIIHQGANYFGHDIARVLEGIPDVRPGKVAVIGVQGQEGEDVVVLIVAPRALEAGIETAIRRTVLAVFGLPVRDVAFVTRIPKTTSGKVARQECRELYREWRDGVRQHGN